jgi:hypothetical protein
MAYSDQTPAAELRAAAQRLRTLAEAATPGPWITADAVLALARDLDCELTPWQVEVVRAAYTPPSQRPPARTYAQIVEDWMLWGEAYLLDQRAIRRDRIRRMHTAYSRKRGRR